MIEMAIIRSLEAQQPIGALIGSRSWVIEAPSNEEMPFLVLSRVSRAGEDSLDGPSGLATHRVQIDVFARDQASLDVLSNLIRKHLSSIAHIPVAVNSDSPPLMVTIQAATQMGEMDTAEEQSQPAVRRRVMDWLVTWNEGDVS